MAPPWDGSPEQLEIDRLRAAWSSAYRQRLEAERHVATADDFLRALTVFTAPSLRERDHDERVARWQERLATATAELAAATAAEDAASTTLHDARRAYRAKKVAL